jgi:hypothetical protein
MKASLIMIGKVYSKTTWTWEKSLGDGQVGHTLMFPQSVPNYHFFGCQTVGVEHLVRFERVLNYTIAVGLSFQEPVSGLSSTFLTLDIRSYNNAILLSL